MNKNYALLILIVLIVNSCCQVANISGVYSYSGMEDLKIQKNNFEIVIDERVINTIIDLSEDDSIASFGKIERIDVNFIKLTSDISYYWSPHNSMVFSELYDETLTDSLQIKFIFPFSGNFEIDAVLNNTPLPTIMNSKVLTVPLSSLNYAPSLRSFYFEIYNKNIRSNTFWGDSFNITYFSATPLYEFKNQDTNVLIVEIPDLTNSYFARYFINEEYAKVEKDKIIWRGRVYERIK
ncbi:MAG: hypothetical protein FWC41_09300 [Firmicutes bacterium]|nr:hypothetical protein [Bacillota bacterium]